MKNRAFIQALISAMLFGIATPFSKTLLGGLQANQLAGLLYLGAAVCLLPMEPALFCTSGLRTDWVRHGPR